MLGETGAIGGTVRYTDSSVERLQAKLTAADPGRYTVTCNGRRMPMHTTGHPAHRWPACATRRGNRQLALHPVLPINAPLTFDIYDTWTGRALGGCTYHVKHPGGRSYDTFPVNSNEAEARRLARFEPHGHTAAACTNRPRNPAPRVSDDPRPAPHGRACNGPHLNGPHRRH